MPEKKMPVRTVEVDYECDVEGCDGVMRNEGYVMMSSPPRYRHYCTKCRAELISTTVYPSIQHEWVEGANT